MGKFYSKIILLMLPAFAMGQLHIKSSTAGTAADQTYVYNKGEILFVTKEIGMDGNPNQDGGNLYLRDEGQLIQGDNSSANSGNGIVSVYQENTRNAWDYHMWTSPVGDPANSTSGNARFYLSSDQGGGIYEVIDELDSDAATFNANYNGIASPLTLSTTWLYKYIATQGYSGWSQITSGNPLLPGEGFSMKGVGTATDSGPTGGTAFDFRGRPNSGTITVNVKPEQRTLVGNPYPSAMNLSYYLLYNSGQSVTNCEGTYQGTPPSGNGVITGEAFFWESDPAVRSHYLADYLGGYGTFVPLMDCTSAGMYTAPTYIMYNEDGTPRAGGPSINTDDPLVNEINRKIAPIGQGFFVLGRDMTSSERIAFDSSGPTTLPTLPVIARNEFRVFIKEESGQATFKKPSSDKGQKNATKNTNIALRAGGLTYDENGTLIMPTFTLSTVVNKKYIRTLKGVMYESATLGFDKAGDGKNRTKLPSDINFKLDGSDKPYLINIFPYNIDNELELTIDGVEANNNFKIKITDLNFTPDEGIWLHDKETDEYHDILNSKYEFELPKGTYTDRFEITFKDGNKENLDLAEEVKESFAVYQNNGRAELTILNPLETELKDISVYDITGKLVVSKINEGTSNKVTIPSNTWSDGIYVVRVVTRDNVEYSKKISVFNKK